MPLRTFESDQAEYDSLGSSDLVKLPSLWTWHWYLSVSTAFFLGGKCQAVFPLHSSPCSPHHCLSPWLTPHGSQSDLLKSKSGYGSSMTKPLGGRWLCFSLGTNSKFLSVAHSSHNLAHAYSWEITSFTSVPCLLLFHPLLGPRQVRSSFRDAGLFVFLPAKPCCQVLFEAISPHLSHPKLKFIAVGRPLLIQPMK